MFTTRRFFLYSPVWRRELVAEKVTQARKGLGTNSVGLASELSLVSKLLQKVILEKISAYRLPSIFCRLSLTIFVPLLVHVRSSFCKFGGPKWQIVFFISILSFSYSVKSVLAVTHEIPRERKIHVKFRRLRDNFEFRNATTRLLSTVHRLPRKGGKSK